KASTSASADLFPVPTGATKLTGLKYSFSGDTTIATAGLNTFAFYLNGSNYLVDKPIYMPAAAGTNPVYYEDFINFAPNNLNLGGSTSLNVTLTHSLATGTLSMIGIFV
ncbi:MAG: hypothetical protein ACREHG_05440, partial [Candidatus Saccharimonadales bacterium]